MGKDDGRKLEPLTPMGIALHVACRLKAAMVRERNCGSESGVNPQGVHVYFKDCNSSQTAEDMGI